MITGENISKKLLSQIAQIKTGVYLHTTQNGDTMYLQAKNFDVKGNLINQLYKDVDQKDLSLNHLLEKDDVLFAAKGEKNFAYHWNFENQAAVASTSFFVIKIIDKSVLPAYITWYLNQEQSLNYLKSMAKGSAIPSINKQVIETFPIPMIDLNKQLKIINLAALLKRELEIRNKLMILKSTLINYKLTELLKN